nr:hypothetical protein [uncultured Pseudomonas sp.]
MELNKAMLDCMQALRRRLRTEMAIDIRLSQPDAINAMLSACLFSSDEETRQLGQRLAQFSDKTTPAAKPATPVALPATLLDTAHVGKTGGSVRIYRGQRVYA